ncbi:MAG: tetratricopeptide repeat protein [Flavobacteriales bacterium]|nr:tetratricopeptide repeat protein [Flavobacteriales bacterium]MCW8912343.1 tetratricopeptide repeat protein [Flavobacteriales bacterium]MCW8938939.1 tetratricopeptide repeat protein [Flavobacteriales bacterium]MCW8967493.1 tetratricopeptide repeat protein [Flavobacteriales bacterium]MCW8989482.1 tetratricopeptide repeat protein [Flavobacteriales bacterium]
MKTRNILYIILLVACFSFQSKASNLDSLSKYISSASEDTTKVEALIKLGKKLRNGQVDSATKIFEQALQLSKKIKWKKGEALAYGTLATCKSIQSDYPGAIEYYYNALAIHEELNNLDGVAVMYAGLGVLYKNTNDLEKALELHNKALEIDLKRGDTARTSLHYGNIGVVYKHLQDFEKALEYYGKALEIDTKNNNIDGQSRHLGNIGVIHKNLENYEEAITYYFKALEISEQQNDLEGILIKSQNIGNLYILLGKYAEAEKYIQRALDLSKQLGSLNGLYSAYSKQTTLYEHMGRDKEALKSLRLAMAYKDSIFNEENKKEILRQEVNFEFEKKQAIEQAQHEKELAVAASEQKRQQLFLVFLAVILLAVIIISFIIYKSLRNSNKQKQLIELQKFEVEQQKIIVDNKNKEITDSIIYARRIQQAILPPKEVLSKNLENGFILYKPKDVVSGDFYWMESSNINGALERAIFLAAADCTGHGVPGAMVSVVCNNALNRAVREFKLTNPAEILDKVRSLVIETFEKSEEEVNDGMDIALCRLQFSESSATLQYAGANNALYIVKANDKEKLVEIKPNKQPIGKVDNPEPFNQHKVELQKGDTIYMFTDGFADQFGGIKGKKLMYKPFKNLLLSIQEKTMNEQKALLEKYFEEWKGSLEQVDDVCIIGVRI